jgi:hypothetical protein
MAKMDAIITASDGGTVWWVQPTYAMAQQVWNDLVNELKPLESVIKVSSGEKTITFKNGGQLSIKSGHEPDRLRGSALDSVIIDEAAFCDEEVWTALRPALIRPPYWDRKKKEWIDRSGKALLLSTPNGRNWFWRLFQKGLDPLESEWVAWQIPTDASPIIPYAEVQSARHDLPARKFQQEYMAQFLDSDGAVFRGILQCIAPPEFDGEAVCFGIDWGRHNDFTAVAVMGMQSRQVLELDRFTGLSWRQQRARIRKLARRWNPRVILAEANSIGGPNIEALRTAGLPVQPLTLTAQNKPTLVDALTVAIEDQRIGLLNDPVLIGELQSYEMARLPSGLYRYSAPSGGHDDTVIAVMLAYHAANLPRAVIRKYA